MADDLTGSDRVRTYQRDGDSKRDAELSEAVETGATAAGIGSAIDWQLDAGSVLSEFAGSTLTVSLADEYELVRLVADVVPDTTSNTDLELQLNGSTLPDYFQVDRDGEPSDPQTEFNLGPMASNKRATTILTVDGRFGDQCYANVGKSAVGASSASEGMDAGLVVLSGSVLTTIEFFTSSADVRGRVAAYGYGFPDSV